MSVKIKKPSKDFTLPILFALSVLLNYGQFSGWVTIADPSVSVPLYPQEAYAAVDALPETPRKIEGGF